MTKYQEYKRMLVQLGACPRGMVFARSGRDPQKLWEKCQNGRHMMFFIAALAKKDPEIGIRFAEKLVEAYVGDYTLSVLKRRDPEGLKRLLSHDVSAFPASIVKATATMILTPDVNIFNQVYCLLDDSNLTAAGLAALLRGLFPKVSAIAKRPARA